MILTTLNQNVLLFVETRRNIMTLTSFMITQKNFKTKAYSIILTIIVLIFYCFKSSSVSAGVTSMILFLLYYSFSYIYIKYFLKILKLLELFSDKKHAGRVLLSINETKNKNGTLFFEKIFIFEERALTISLTSFAALYLFLFLGVVCNRYLVPCIHIISHSKYNLFSSSSFLIKYYLSEKIILNMT